MEIVQIVSLCFIVTFLILIVKQQKPELAVPLSLTLAAIIFLMVVNKLGVVLNLFRELAEKAQISQLYLTTILKIIGIAYITELWPVKLNLPAKYLSCSWLCQLSHLSLIQL